jgi:hypothetical protein
LTTVEVSTRANQRSEKFDDVPVALKLLALAPIYETLSAFYHWTSSARFATTESNTTRYLILCRAPESPAPIYWILLFELRSENLHLFLLQSDCRFELSATRLLLENRKHCSKLRLCERAPENRWHR